MKHFIKYTSSLLLLLTTTLVSCNNGLPLVSARSWVEQHYKASGTKPIRCFDFSWNFSNSAGDRAYIKILHLLNIELNPDEPIYILDVIKGERKEQNPKGEVAHSLNVQTFDERFSADPAMYRFDVNDEKMTVTEYCAPEVVFGLLARKATIYDTQGYEEHVTIFVNRTSIEGNAVVEGSIDITIHILNFK